MRCVAGYVPVGIKSLLTGFARRRGSHRLPLTNFYSMNLAFQAKKFLILPSKIIRFASYAFT